MALILRRSQRICSSASRSLEKFLVEPWILPKAVRIGPHHPTSQPQPIRLAQLMLLPNDSNHAKHRLDCEVIASDSGHTFLSSSFLASFCSFFAELTVFVLVTIRHGLPCGDPSGRVAQLGFSWHQLNNLVNRDSHMTPRVCVGLSPRLTARDRTITEANCMSFAPSWL